MEKMNRNEMKAMMYLTNVWNDIFGGYYNSMLDDQKDLPTVEEIVKMVLAEVLSDSHIAKEIRFLGKAWFTTKGLPKLMVRDYKDLMEYAEKIKA